MKMHSPALKSVLLLLFSSSFLICPSLSQLYGNCPMLTEGDLGMRGSASNMGLLAEFLGNPVELLRSNFVCSSSGTLRSTYSSATAVVEYQCCNNTFPRMEQLDLICNISNQWTFNPIPPESDPPSFNAALRTQCSFCTPSNPGGSQVYDFGTHCVGKFIVLQKFIRCCIITVLGGMANNPLLSSLAALS